MLFPSHPGVFCGSPILWSIPCRQSLKLKASPNISCFVPYDGFVFKLAPLSEELMLEVYWTTINLYIFMGLYICVLCLSRIPRATWENQVQVASYRRTEALWSLLPCMCKIVCMPPFLLRLRNSVIHDWKC